MSGPTVHPAAAQARRVVGLYSDPTITWAIGLVADLHDPIAPTAVGDRLGHLTVAHPHLGLAPSVECVSGGAFDATVDRLLNTAFDGSGRLVRVAMTDDGSRLAVVAHHGVVDGLGLLSVLGTAAGTEAGTLSRGVGASSARTTFGRSVLGRLQEALLFPPSRLSADDDVSPRVGDVTATRCVPALATNTAVVAAAATRLVTQWNGVRGDRARRIVLAVGASRRTERVLRPDCASTFLRIRLAAGSTTAQVRDVIARTAPEPDFPALGPRGRLGQVAARLLRHRLGSTLLVSNLGRVTNLDAVHRLAFYPAAAGPRGAAIGVASTADTTTVTVRLSRRAFTAASARTMCDDVASWLVADAASTGGAARPGGDPPTTSRRSH